MLLTHMAFRVNTGGWSGFGSKVEDRALSAPEAQSPTLMPYSWSAPLDVNTSNALRVSDAWACVRLLADSIASLPLKAFRRTAEGRVSARDQARISQLL